MNVGQLLGALGIGVILGFGLWWMTFPQSVIRFYTWFHGPRRMPRPIVIRVIGALWTLWLIVISLMQSRHR